MNVMTEGVIVLLSQIYPETKQSRPRVLNTHQSKGWDGKP